MKVYLELFFGLWLGESSAWAAAKSTVYDLFILLIGFLDLFRNNPAPTIRDPKNPEPLPELQEEAALPAPMGELWLELAHSPRSIEPPVSERDFLNLKSSIW